MVFVRVRFAEAAVMLMMGLPVRAPKVMPRSVVVLPPL